VKFSFGIPAAFCYKIKQFVFAGLATTKHLTSLSPTSAKALPYSLKIFPLVFNISFLS